MIYMHHHTKFGDPTTDNIYSNIYWTSCSFDVLYKGKKNTLYHHMMYYHTKFGDTA